MLNNLIFKFYTDLWSSYSSLSAAVSKAKCQFFPIPPELY